MIWTMAYPILDRWSQWRVIECEPVAKVAYGISEDFDGGLVNLNIGSLSKVC